MPDIPDGVNTLTAQIALAWEMVKTATQNSKSFREASKESRMDILLTLYSKAIDGIQNPGKWKKET